MNDPFIVLEGIMLTACITDIVMHAEGFEWMLLRYQGYCPHCRYKLNHPIVKHDDVIGECGWR